LYGYSLKFAGDERWLLRIRSDHNACCLSSHRVSCFVRQRSCQERTHANAKSCVL